MAASGSELRLGRRYRGPPGTANGGYACGMLAAVVGGGAAEATLRRPLPLERPLGVRRDGDRVLVADGEGILLAEAGPAADVELTAPSVTAEEALAVAGRSRYYDDPVFPDCFVCGPARPPGDGLGVFPGPLPGRAVWAAPWVPHPSVADADGAVRPEVLWAALDCPSGIAAAEAAGLPDGTAVVLGRMAATLAARPRAGTPCRVVAWPGRVEGRKLAAASALVGPGGEVLAAARTLWLTVVRPPGPA